MPAQDQWAEHAAFMNGLVDAGLILLGGPTVRTFDERWERTTPRLTDGLGDPRQRGLSPVPTCSHFERESRYKAAPSRIGVPPHRPEEDVPHRNALAHPQMIVPCNNSGG